MAQARAWIDIGDYEAARSALTLAEEDDDTSREIDRLSYLAGSPRLSVRSPTDDPNDWFLMTSAQAGNGGAEDALVKRVLDGTVQSDARINANRVALRHFANDYEKLQSISLILAKETDISTKRLIRIAEIALDQGNLTIANSAVTRAEELDKNADGLEALRKRLAEQAEESKSALSE